MVMDGEMNIGISVMHYLMTWTCAQSSSFSFNFSKIETPYLMLHTGISCVLWLVDTKTSVVIRHEHKVLDMVIYVILSKGMYIQIIYGY